MTAPPLWKASVSVPKQRAGDVAALFELAPPELQAVLVVEDPFGPISIVEALYETPPDASVLTGLVGAEVLVAPLPDQDWNRLSQIGLAPVRAGRFFVYGAHDAGEVPSGVIPIRIEAGLAFGTGHHETTALCLAALSDLKQRRNPLAILDLGCGTAVLAIACAKLWHVPVLATDIDPIAVETARENAHINSVAPLVRTVIAEGLGHPSIRAAAPFDLIAANILARPLTRLACGVAAALAPRGTVLLSGLLRDQETLVLGYYRSLGLVFVRAYRDGPWSALVLARPGR